MANISSISTPQMERVRQLCDQAKTTPEGLIIWFRVTKYGDLKTCKNAARSMQVSFCNLRVRSRRLMQKMKGEPDYALISFTRGEYDDIACVVRPIPHDGGYTVRFSPAYSIDMDLEVTDAATGEPFAGEDPTQNRYIVLMGKWFKEDTEATLQRRARLNPFTTDELKFMWAHDPQMSEEMRLPSLTANEVHDRTDYASVDLADLDEDELEIVNPGDGE